MAVSPQRTKDSTPTQKDAVHLAASNGEQPGSEILYDCQSNLPGEQYMQPCHPSEETLHDPMA